MSLQRNPHPAARACFSRIFLVVPRRVHVLDLAGPLQIFGTLRELGAARPAIHCVGPSAALTSFQGLALAALGPLPARLERGDVVIVIGAKLAFGEPLARAHGEIVGWLRETVAPRLGDVQLASVCTGAFLLGAAGLLDDRRCTTHHDHLARLQRRHPLAQVLAGRIVVDDGALLSSAGVSAGIDLALHLVARRAGPDVAVRVARDNLVPFRRLRHDPELDVLLRHREHQNATIHAVQDCLAAQPAASEPFDALAARFALSYRHLARLFQQECGLTLKQYQQQLRLALARGLLKDGDMPIEHVAERSGFASVQAFRAAWRQEEALSPSRWRDQFR